MDASKIQAVANPLAEEPTKFSPHFSSFKFEPKKAYCATAESERLLGAALETIFTGILVYDQRRSIYNSISGTKLEPISQSLMREPIFGTKSRSEFAHLWNKAVDQTFQKANASITSSGW